MKNQSIIRQEQVDSENADASAKPASLSPDLTARKVEALRQKAANISNRNSLRISALREGVEQPVAAREAEDDGVLMLSAASHGVPVKRPLQQTVIHYSGVVFTILWAGFSLNYLVGNYTLATFTALTPPQLGGMLTGLLAPVALLWIVLGRVQRDADIQRHARALRSELQSIIFPSEERAQRVGKDIERLCLQAAELATASKTVIKAISRARQGLRTEIRDFVGVSKKTEFHIDRLAGVLNERAAKLLDLTGEIEQRASVIGEQSQAGADAWDKATLTVLTRAEEMETALGRGADKILEAASEADGKVKGVGQHLAASFENLNEEVARIAGRLDEVSAEFGEHTKGLANTAEQVSSETARLSGTVREQISSLEDVVAKTVEAMVHSSDNIQSQRESLDRGAQGLAEQAARIADTINVSVSGLEGAANTLATRTGDLEGRISAQAENLHETVKGITREAEAIEEAGVSAANKLSEAMGVALSGAESIGVAVRRSIESLDKSTQAARQQAESLIESTKNHIGQINDAGEGNVEHIRAIVTLLEKSREQIEAASSLADDQVESRANINGSEPASPREIGGHLTEVRRGVGTPHSPTVEAQYAQRSGFSADHLLVFIENR